MRIQKLDFPVKIDIGCGKGKIENFVGIDCLDFGQEIVWDVTKGIPLTDNSVSEIHTSHFLEHIENKDLQLMFDEFYRVCEDGALVTIIMPHADTIEAHYLCHYSMWSENKIEGIVKDTLGKMEIKTMERDGIHLKAELVIKKNATT